MSAFSWYDWAVVCFFLRCSLLYACHKGQRMQVGSEEVLALLATFLLWRLS